jgi:hypothetical protein
MKLNPILAATLAAGLAAAPGMTLAHHSFAMFDSTKELTLTGTVKEFQWENPHTWIQLYVPDAQGKQVEWSIEGTSPNGLARKGWKRNSIKPGDKIVVKIRPLRDGRPGGSLMTVAGADGRFIGETH